MSSYALMGIIAGILVCIGLCGCIGCYVGGRYREMQKQTLNESQMRQDLQNQLNKAHTLISNLNSMSSLTMNQTTMLMNSTSNMSSNNSLNNSSLPKSDDSLPAQPKVTDDGHAMDHIAAVAAADVGIRPGDNGEIEGIDDNTTQMEMVTVKGMNNNNNGIGISDGDYAETGGNDDDMSRDDSPELNVGGGNTTFGVDN